MGRLVRAELAVAIRWVPGLLHRARTDSLVRNSLYLIASTGITAGLGYVFWIIAAHALTHQEVGIGGAVISLCSTITLVTYVGPSAMLIETLPGSEHTPAWDTILFRTCLATAAVTAVVTAIAVPALLAVTDYRLFFNAAAPILLTVGGAAAWTLVSLFGSAFIAARRAGRYLTIQGLVSLAKVVFVLPLAAVGAGAAGVVGAWVAGAGVGIGAGIAWLIPGMGLSPRSGCRPRRRMATASRGHPQPRPSGHRPGRSVPDRATYARRLLGQHMTLVGGAVTPLFMPVLVVIRLGAALNAYFYITWMLGSVFFTVSPSVSTALFAEGVRLQAELHRTVVKALRVISVILAPAMLVTIAAGRLVLSMFGASYAAAGYGLLVLLAISALPDAVSNVAVAVLRITHRLGYSTRLNIGIFVVTVVCAWFLMPPLGILGAGVAWLGAQTLGAAASLPALAQARKVVNS